MKAFVIKHCIVITVTRTSVKLRILRNTSREFKTIHQLKHMTTLAHVFSCCSLNSMIAISCTIFTKISSFRFFYILREYENKLYTTKL